MESKKTRSSKKRKTKLRLFDLLPDELIHVILEYRLSVDYYMFSYRSPARLLAHRAEVKAFSLMCRRWRRIILPISYDTVIITSKAEANALAFKLRQRDQRISHYIKKLRIQGGHSGWAIYTILSKVPRLETLCISLDNISSQSMGRLCRGLKLVNPQHFVLRDLKFLGNQGVQDVTGVLIECMTSIWSNLVSYDHPYDEIWWSDSHNSILEFSERHKRAESLSRALAFVPNLQTIYVPRAYYIAKNDVVLNAAKNPSLRRIYSRSFWPSESEPWHHWNFEVVLQAHPRFREVVHFPLPGPWMYPVYAPVGDRSLLEMQKTFTFFIFKNHSPVYRPDDRYFFPRFRLRW